MEMTTKKMKSAWKNLENSRTEKQEFNGKHKKMMDSYFSALGKFIKQQLNSNPTFVNHFSGLMSPHASGFSLFMHASCNN